jgi:hypothetical protein
MAGSFSNYAETKLIGLVFKQNTFASPTNLYVGLSTTALTTAQGDACTGTTFTGEVTGGGYVRKKCNTWDAAGATAGDTENSQVVTFAQATKSWGNLKSFGIFTKTTKGNLIGWGLLTASKTIASSDTFKFATGDIDVTLS